MWERVENSTIYSFLCSHYMNLRFPLKMKKRCLSLVSDESLRMFWIQRFSGGFCHKFSSSDINEKVLNRASLSD